MGVGFELGKHIRPVPGIESCILRRATISFLFQNGNKFSGGCLFGLRNSPLSAPKELRIRELMPNSLDSLQGSLPREIFCKFRAENNDFSIYSKFAPAILSVLLRRTVQNVAT